MRASKGFRAAADFVAAQAKLYGLEEVTVHEIPADGHTMYGTQKARLAMGSGVRRAVGDARGRRARHAGCCASPASRTSR